MFTSDRENQSNLFRYDLDTGLITQITDLQGPGRPGGCVSAANNALYFGWKGQIIELGLETLQEGYRKLLAQIYEPQFYYERVMTFLREYQPPKIRFHPDPQYLLALGRSIYQLGIRGVERAHYWRLLFWTLYRRPRLFHQAIALSIIGFHFRQVIELHVG